MRLALLVSALLALGAGCTASAPTDPAGALRVLFVGNSLTATHDLPAVVEALGAHAGRPTVTQAITVPNASLEDHWRLGTARDQIADGGWDVVVLQQGPSTLDASRAHLVEWAGAFAEAARAAGAEPALYMVWPPAGTPIERSEASYAAAAEATGARLLPAGRAWRLAEAEPAAPALRGPDGFHPRPTGTLLAALAVHGGLHGALPDALPAAVRVGGADLRLDASTRALLLAAAGDALATDGVAP